jgi:hypothetical protein
MSQLDAPYMLDDLTRNCQRLSASLPPDGWDPDLPAVRIARQPSGIIECVALKQAFAVKFTERDDSAARLDSRKDVPTAGTEAVGEQDRLLSAGGVERQLEDGRVELENQGEQRGVFQSLKRLVWNNWRRSDTKSCTPSKKSILQRLKNGLRHLWPCQDSGSKRRTRAKRQTPGTEPLL